MSPLARAPSAARGALRAVALGLVLLSSEAAAAQLRPRSPAPPQPELQPPPRPQPEPAGLPRPLVEATERALRDALALPPTATVEVYEARANDRALAAALRAPGVTVRSLRLAPGQRGLSGAVTAWLTLDLPPRHAARAPRGPHSDAGFEDRAARRRPSGGSKAEPRRRRWIRGGAPREGWVRLGVRVQVPQVVAARSVPRGQPLSPQDLRVELRPLTARPGLESLDLALGQLPTRALRPGEPVRSSSLRPRPVVGRGARVTAIVRRGTFEIRAPAETLAAAPRGGTLRVRLVATRKTVDARALGPHTVEVLP